MGVGARAVGEGWTVGVGWMSSQQAASMRVDITRRIIGRIRGRISLGVMCEYVLCRAGQLLYAVLWAGLGWPLSSSTPTTISQKRKPIPVIR